MVDCRKCKSYSEKDGKPFCFDNELTIPIVRSYDSICFRPKDEIFVFPPCTGEFGDCRGCKHSVDEVRKGMYNGVYVISTDGKCGCHLIETIVFDYKKINLHKKEEGCNFEPKESKKPVFPKEEKWCGNCVYVTKEPYLNDRKEWIVDCVQSNGRGLTPCLSVDDGGKVPNECGNFKSKWEHPLPEFTPTEKNCINCENSEGEPYWFEKYNSFLIKCKICGNGTCGYGYVTEINNFPSKRTLFCNKFILKEPVKVKLPPIQKRDCRKCVNFKKESLRWSDGFVFDCNKYECFLWLTNEKGDYMDTVCCDNDEYYIESPRNCTNCKNLKYRHITDIGKDDVEVKCLKEYEMNYYPTEYQYNCDKFEEKPKEIKSSNHSCIQCCNYIYDGKCSIKGKDPRVGGSSEFKLNTCDDFNKREPEIPKIDPTVRNCVNCKFAKGEMYLNQDCWSIYCTEPSKVFVDASCIVKSGEFLFPICNKFEFKDELETDPCKNCFYAKNEDEFQICTNKNNTGLIGGLNPCPLKIDMKNIVIGSKRTGMSAGIITNVYKKEDEEYKEEKKMAIVCNCIKCGSRNQANAKFCSNCGNKMKLDDGLELKDIDNEINSYEKQIDFLKEQLKKNLKFPLRDDKYERNGHKFKIESDCFTQEIHVKGLKGRIEFNSYVKEEVRIRFFGRDKYEIARLVINSGYLDWAKEMEIKDKQKKLEKYKKEFGE